MYSESWNQIPRIIVLNCSLSVVSWRFYHFLKLNKPRVKYMFLKDNFPVPVFLILSVLLSISKRKKYSPVKKFRFGAYLRRTFFSWCLGFLLSTCSAKCGRQPFSGDTHGDLCSMFSSPSWAAVPTDVCKGVPCHFKPLEVFQFSDRAVKAGDRCLPFSLWLHYHVPTVTHNQPCNRQCKHPLNLPENAATNSHAHLPLRVSQILSCAPFA